MSSSRLILCSASDKWKFPKWGRRWFTSRTGVFGCSLTSLGRCTRTAIWRPFAPHALAVAARAVAADYTAYSEMNLRRKRLVAIAHPQEIELTLPDAATASFFGQHPLVQYLEQHGDVPALRISDFLTRRQYRETGLYREVFRTSGVEYQMGCTLPSRSPRLSVSLTYNRSHRDFSIEDRLMLDLLRPHLFQAYRNAETITRLREHAAHAESGLEALRYGTIVVDAAGRIDFCSTRAGEWLAAYFEKPRTTGRLPDRLLDWFYQQQLSATTSDSPPSLRMPLVIARSSHRLVMQLVKHSGGRQVLLLEERAEWSAEPLESLGLTPRQAEVLLWVAQGKTNKEIGMILGVRADTVHKHLEQVFAKLSVETRTAAALRATEVLKGA